jgi:hypothetical protein
MDKREGNAERSKGFVFDYIVGWIILRKEG